MGHTYKKTLSSPLTITRTITYYSYMLEYIIDKSAIFIVNLFDDCDKIYNTFKVKLESEDYDNWVLNDKFIIDYIEEHIEQYMHQNIN